MRQKAICDSVTAAATAYPIWTTEIDLVNIAHIKFAVHFEDECRSWPEGLGGKEKIKAYLKGKR